jgi:hypothetical protein
MGKSAAKKNRARKKSPAEVSAAVYTVGEFCTAYRISRSQLYKLWDQQIGPRVIRIGTKNLITVEAAREWAATREAASIQQNRDDPQSLSASA